MYIDESGDTVPISQKGKNFLILTGCILHENDKFTIENDFRKIKQKYYQNPDIEIKSNFLRYANPDLKEFSPIKLNDREKYNELEKDMTEFLKLVPINLYSIVIHKEGYWSKYPSQNPYSIAYIFLIERFQKFLAEKKAFGIAIIDPREGQVEKSFMNDELDDVHDKLRWQDSSFWKKCPNVIEKILFSASDKTIGIQLADLYCYPVFHIFEYNKKTAEYWRFNETVVPKLCVSTDGKLDGIGIKFFPEESKKGLRYFS
jgi:hypothetical protein